MIGVTGINHKTASQDIRAFFNFTRDEIIPFSELVQQKTEITEIVVLSTCHRTELYYYHDKTCDKRVSKILAGLLHDFKRVPGNYDGSFYNYTGRDAVKHLFKVTSGVDSVVIGEDQIVNQVKEAYMIATEAVQTDAVLMRLFQKSFETSKRVRTETDLQQGPTSLSNVAADMCCKVFNDITDKCVLLVGSGETGRLALHYLKKRGVTRTYVANRTYENALALAGEYNSTVVDFEKFRDHLPECDIVVVATGADEYLISKADVQAAMAGRDTGIRLYIDLSLPRNIEKAVSGLKNVKLYGVDDMQEIVDANSGKRMMSVGHAGEIIDEMTEEFILWFDCLALRPLIKTIRMNMQKIRDNEMIAYRSAEDEQKFDIIDEYTNRITQKYIGMIIKNLREVSGSNPSSHSLNIVNKLFKFEK